MKKATYYFSHDYNAIQDPEMMLLFSECGPAGIGLYWIVIEALHSQADGRMSFESFQSYLRFYKGTLVEQELTRVEQALSKTLLFRDGDFISSKRVLKNKETMEFLSKRRSEAGKKSAEVRALTTRVQQVSTSVEQVPTKEKKIKENKIKEISNTGTDVPRTLFKPPDQKEVEDYITAKGWDVSADRFVAFYESKGWMIGKNKMKDWKAAVKTWQYSNHTKSSGDDEPWIIKKK